MPKKGNGLDLANEYLRQLTDLAVQQNEKLDRVTNGLLSLTREVTSVKQEVASVKQELGEHGVRLSGIENAVRRIAAFVGQEFDDLKRRVDALERKAA